MSQMIDNRQLVEGYLDLDKNVDVSDSWIGDVTINSSLNFHLGIIHMEQDNHYLKTRFDSLLCRALT